MIIVIYLKTTAFFNQQVYLIFLIISFTPLTFSILSTPLTLLIVSTPFTIIILCSPIHDTKGCNIISMIYLRISNLVHVSSNNVTETFSSKQSSFIIVRESSLNLGKLCDPLSINPG